MDSFALQNDELYCEDVPLAEIAAEVGTPVYVYSTAKMHRQVDALRSALEALANPLICYAVKANPNPAVVATLAKAGLGADVVSGGEYRRAVEAGVDPGAIVFSGVGKTEEEMRLALGGGLYQFNLESLDEAEMLSGVAISMGLVAPVGFRVNPDVPAGTHSKISTGATNGLPHFPACLFRGLPCTSAASSPASIRLSAHFFGWENLSKRCAAPGITSASRISGAASECPTIPTSRRPRALPNMERWSKA